MTTTVIILLGAIAFCSSRYLDQQVDNHKNNRLSNYNPDVDFANPEEMGEYSEGDMVMTIGNRNGLTDKTKRWPEGVVPFVIDPKTDDQFQETILLAMRLYHQYTCIKFRPKRPEDRDFLFIQNERSGCWSNVGRMGGMQRVNLEKPGCTIQIGTPIHELMHAIGFVHEQNRWERDDYVTVNWNNIKTSMQANFIKHKYYEVFGQNVTYDYDSVMHYSKYAFSKNNKPTIEPKVNVRIGQREGFSRGDVIKINAMYKCHQGASSSRTQNNADLLTLLSHIYLF